MSLLILRGDILYSKDRDNLAGIKRGYIAVEDGKVEGTYEKLPEKFSGLPVRDFGDGVIIPAFSDLHVHASQYAERGLGMDCLLYDWLNGYTFPQEAKFSDLGYAARVYDAFCDREITHGTFHLSAFATIHRKATDYLFEAMEKRGLKGYVGKVNMDVNSPRYLCETARETVAETERFLARHAGADRVKPIITPRFAPTCSEESIKALGKLGEKYGVGLQTHVVESRWEAGRALEGFPGYGCDSEIYRRNGLLDNGVNIFAHVIFPSRRDIEIMKKYSVYTVHCPDATNNVIAGIMPFSSLARQGVKISLGSDVGGGHHPAIYRQVAKAVQLSKLKEFYEGRPHRAITFAQAFRHATKEGGSAFGKTGTFEKGYRFDALVIDGMEDPGLPLSPAEKAERFCYTGDDRNITARFIDGKEL